MHDSDVSLITTNPGFVDQESQNYHLTEGSVALDRCSIIGVDDALVHRGRDFENRPYDLTGVNNGMGNYDVGADEPFPYEIDVIFKSDFE